MTITENVTLEPNWITTTLYVDGNASETESEPDALTTGTAVKSLSAAVNKLVTYEALDGETSDYQHEWTISVNGKCYGKTYLVNAAAVEPLKITKLTIAGDNNEEDILDGSVYETGTNTFAVISYDTGGYPLILENLKIQNGTLDNGGGLQITDNTVYLNNVVLKGNTANKNGGGLNITNSTAYLDNVILIDNTASDNGGAIALTNSKLFIYGGCHIGPDVATDVATDTACSNKAGKNGGGIYADENSTIYFGYTAADEANGTMTAETDTPSNIITYNYAGDPTEGSYCGGGIYCLGKLYTNGGTISYNSATHGGGISVSNETHLTGTTISGNKATTNGGGIYVESGNSAILFLSGKTTIGAASVTSFASSTSNSNSARNGGGIYLGSSTQAYLNYTSKNDKEHTGIVNITYNYATAPYSNEGGGGIYAEMNSELYIAPGTTINYNATNMNGGGIYGKEGTTYMSGGTIYGNNASLSGGGIYLSGEDYSGYIYYGTLYMYGDAIIGTSEKLIDNSYSNSALYGGGIYLADSYSQAYLGYSGIDGENKLITKELSGGVSYNKAFDPDYDGIGGGIYNKGLLQVSSGSISNNISETDGGGVYNKGDFQFSSGKIESNEAGNNGGGVYNPSGKTFTMTGGGTIASNTAVYGGGVYNKGIFHVSKGYIKSNTVTENGGGIYAASGSTTDKTVLENSEITKNTAKDGGGIYMYEDDLYIKKATTFNENTATNSGGAVYAYYTTIKIQEQAEDAYAYIEPDPVCNDVYLGDYSTISADQNELSDTHYYIARFTPHSYATDIQYIDDIDDTTYTKFLVTPQSVKNSTTNMQTQVLWETTDDGHITTDNTTFVKIPAASITGPVTGSGVFVEGRPTLELPSFYICDHEVTQGEYEKYCFYGVTIDWDTWTQYSTDKVVKDDNYPACFVSWYDAVVYCNLRSIAEGLEPVYYFKTTSDGTTTLVTNPANWVDIVPETTEEDREIRYRGPSPDDTVDPWSEIKQDYTKSGWRLPLEAEWEYAARGANGPDGTLDIETYDYSGSNTLNEVAWMLPNSSVTVEGYYYPHEVKGDGLNPNRLGLYDMSGNVVELCWDWYSDDLSAAAITGPASPDTNYYVAAPGGAYQWSKTLNERSSNPKNARFCNAGFRIVRTIKE